MNMEDKKQEFSSFNNLSKSIIKVIGIGGGGSNAVNYMYKKGIKDVEFVICNTDLQALESSAVPAKLQIGATLTEGLGAGANPEIGREAALESKEEIRELLSHNTKMLFITAGMGGGTGTGAAPVLAEIARELGILTVAIVTYPFIFEGRKKRDYAEEGIKSLKESCDTVLIISNDKLREIYGNLKMSEAFSQADNILKTAAKSIAEIITVEGDVNVDFEDVKTVMRNSGAAVMGSAKTEGENRAIRAAQEALNSPLLDNKDIHGSKKILLSVMSGDKAELQMDELSQITDYIQDKAGNQAEMIFGFGTDPSLGASISVTIIATGFSESGRNVPETKVDNTPKVEEEEKKEEEVVDNRNFVFNINTKSNFEDIKEKKVDEKVIFDLDDEIEEDEDFEGNTFYNKKSDYDLKKEKLSQEADERINKLKKLSKNYENNNSESLKEKIEVPAYLRRNVKLSDNSNNSSNGNAPENKLSQFNSNTNNQILGNNKFFMNDLD